MLDQLDKHLQLNNCHVDKGWPVGIFYAVFSKAFDTFSPEIFIDKLLMCEPVKQIMKQAENCLHGQTQSTVIGVMKSNWKTVASSVPWCLYWVQSYLTLSLMIWMRRPECSLSISVDNTKLGGALIYTRALSCPPEEL